MPGRPKIGFVYFDLGHVIVPIKRGVFIDELAAVSELSKEEIADILGHGYDSSRREYWDVICDFDRGKLYPHEFYEKMSKLLRLHTNFQKFAAIWQIMLDIDRRFTTILATLEVRGIGCGIISDLCLLHYNRFIQLISQDYFNIRFFSFLEGRLKKEDGGETFRRAVKAAGTKAPWILFVDDRQENIDAAELHGMKTFLYDDNFDELVVYLKKMGV